MTPRTIATAPQIDDLIDQNAPVAIGVSGGKDSQAAALATFRYLDSRQHSGARLLIHSDLGVTEWSQSLPVCEKLARHLGAELAVIRRQAGDMMDRWETRWASSKRRYHALETVTLVLPWSTPKLRFCTSELKTKLIRSALAKRFKGTPVVNVTGVRREESRARARQAIFDTDPTQRFWNWRPLADWSEHEVFKYIHAQGLSPHPAYSEYGMSRVSCVFCIMSSLADLCAATRQKETHELYRRMVDLEVASSFAFQGHRWLADIAPHLLSPETIASVARAKCAAQERARLEASITSDMRYVKGWPTRILTQGEATLLANVRRGVGRAVGIDTAYTSPDSIRARYADLIAERERRHRRAA